MIQSYLKAFSQLPDPRFRRVILLSLCFAVLLYGVTFVVLGWVFGELAILAASWWETGGAILGGAAVVVASLFLFPAVLSGFVGLFLDDIVTAVEAEHYPTLPDTRPQGFLESLAGSLRFAGLALLVNLIALPLYFIPPVNAFAFLLVNGFLLGREYFELVALRRLSRTEVYALSRYYRRRLWWAGTFTAVLLLVPFVNILAPLVGVAAMVHILQGLDMGKALPVVVEGPGREVS
ncbi:hypothetical protein HEQ62_10620 [Haematospirillum jordaniae]|uniref:EI24 domain-containing protein n=1 Tax=Haematospirillum jordaniae TaxID=1549855 RepID=UPI000AF73609|nr:EI24 domain-containing protein [Haematospirillum jordaniae]NKD46194.1 hypothetical protein [Haematospirillum jordaniae]NKD58112.1 hypothetical protein [Haematospirillum jordaniae]NKD60221.1 hypothetical protein [Haematospirillum jordaniae]NKD68145.1 hypothetical protein [Haematospirillum jordaniae]NKD80176.1 hypothetical protein [Haematospirillum jordaniae]